MDKSGYREGYGGWVRVAAAKRRAGRPWFPVHHSIMSTAAARLSRREKEVHASWPLLLVSSEG